MRNKQVVVIGGGIAGLNCCRLLSAARVNFVLLEASDRLGGRVATEIVDGFRLDVGFQVLQTAYPEAQVALRMEDLQLVELEPGALIRKSGKWYPLLDPWRRPSYAASTIFSPLGSFADRLRLARLWWQSAQAGGANPSEDTTTAQFLQQFGFTDEFTDSFLRPWLGGIFLEDELATSAYFFRFVFRMLAAGQISYPAAGMHAIPQQLAETIPEKRIRLNAPVRSIEGMRVLLESGECIDARAIVIATDVSTASKLTNAQVRSRAHTATRCIYFAAERKSFGTWAPSTKPILLLNGDSEKAEDASAGCSNPFNHVFIMSAASPSVAPPGRVLVSVNQVGAAARAHYEPTSVRQHLRNWFGKPVDRWQELRVYDIRHALPAQPPGFAMSSNHQLTLPKHWYVCGDHCDTASLNGALGSGRLAAERVIADDPHDSPEASSDIDAST